MRVLLLGVCIFLSPFLLSAQTLTQTIRGTILETDTDVPVVGATVVLLDTTLMMGTSTDINGRFRLENVPVGRRSVRITFIGYKPKNYFNLEVTSAKETVLHVLLEEDITVFEEVVVIAEGKKNETVNKMATASARTFSIEESKRYAGSLNDVARMAQNFAGVQGTNDTRNDIIIRGNSPIGVLYRLEGLDIPNPNHFGSFGTTGGPVSILNNNVLANSDFMTGAFPAEYGNAYAGVFDLKMREGNDEQYEFLGQMGFNGLELMAEGPFSKKSKASFLFSYRYSTLEVLQLLGINFGTSSVPKYQDLSFKLNFPHKKGKTSVFGLGGISSISLLHDKNDENERFGENDRDIVFKTKMGAVGVSHNHLFSKNAYIRFLLAASSATQVVESDSISSFDEHPVPVYRNNSTHSKLTFKTVYNRKVNQRNLFRIGNYTERLTFKVTDSTLMPTKGYFQTLSDFDGSAFLFRSYALWQYRLTDQVTFNTGVHHQYFALNNKAALEPRIGVKLKLGKKSELNAAYGLHSQIAPMEIYFSQVLLQDGSYYKPNKSLGFLKSHHYVLSFQQNLGHQTRIKTEAYVQQLRNVPVDHYPSTYSLLNQGADFTIGYPDTLANNGKGINYGLEITAERFLSAGFYYLATVSLYRSKFQGSNKEWYSSAFDGFYTVNLLTGKEFEINKNKKDKKFKTYIVTDAKLTLNGGKRYSPILLEKSIEIDSEVRDHSKAYESKYADYMRMDLRLGLKINRKNISHEIGIDLQNITNRSNIFTIAYDSTSKSIQTEYQPKFIPLALYRIYF